MVPLNEQGTGLIHVGIQLTTGRPVDFNVVMHLDAVEGHTYSIALDGSFHLLPFTCFA